MAKRADDPGNRFSPKSPEKPQPSGTAPVEAAKAKAEPDTGRPAEPRGGYSLIILVAIIVTCLGIIYYLANAHHRIGDLDLSLLKTRGELAATTGKVEESRDQIFKISYGLTENRSQTVEQKRQLEIQNRQLEQQQARYRRLSAGVRKMRADYRRELQEIEREKADRTEMHKLEQDVQSLKKETDSLKQKEVQNEVPAAENIAHATMEPAAPVSPKEPTTENYDFHLQKEDGVLWLLNVGLDLKKVKLSDKEDAKYELEVRVDGTKIKKKDGHVNEPIYVQVAGSDQPYRLVVTKIEKDQVKGYLTVPKA